MISASVYAFAIVPVLVVAITGGAVLWAMRSAARIDRDAATAASGTPKPLSPIRTLSGSATATVTDHAALKQI